jgi:hypothetical protein
LLTTALKSLATAGAGSPSDNSPSEGLAERIAGDPRATPTLPPWFKGETGAAWEPPVEETDPGLVEAGSGKALIGRIGDGETVVPAPGAAGA